jgi:hypothetical protein
MLAAAAPAILLAAVALWEIVAVGRASARAASPEDWRALSAALRQRRRSPEELIVFAPSWIDPLGRQALGDLIPIDMAARMDAARYPVIWEAALEGARASETRGLEPVSTERFGRLVLRRYQQAPALVVTDFVAAFDRAAVAGRSVGKPTVSVEEVGFEPHRCVRVTPQPDGTATITYRAVALGRELVGYVGLADVFTRRDIRDPARLVVTIDGAPVADVQVGVDDGWMRFAARTQAHAAEVTFAATALGPGARDRRVCFAAEARR